MSLIREGKMKPLVVTGAKRMGHLPNVETVMEVGYPVEAYAFIGYVLPAATPRDVVLRLNREIGAILAREDMRQKLAEQGADVARTEQTLTHSRELRDRRFMRIISLAPEVL